MCWGTTFNVYNLYLESWGERRPSRFAAQKALEDAARYTPRVPTVLTADLNFDVSEGYPAVLIRQTGVSNVLGESRFCTRPARNVLASPRSIDWTFIFRDPGRQTLGQLHEIVNASD